MCKTYDLFVKSAAEGLLSDILNLNISLLKKLNLSLLKIISFFVIKLDRWKISLQFQILIASYMCVKFLFWLSD